MILGFFVLFQRMALSQSKWLLVVIQINLLYGSDITLVAEAKRLHSSPFWFKLLHYENGKSTIVDKEFFLAPDGDRDPKQELIATIKTFEEKPQARCKYPARFTWLQSEIDLNSSLQDCSELNLFLDQNYTKIELVFTTERFNSPATLFGHTFLRLTSSTIPYVIDYAAATPNDPLLLYAYKGIFGKYKSKYSIVPFSVKDFEYRQEEFRDLLLYNLNFSASEIRNMLYHLYEIKDYQQNYYFFSNNCSSELIKLLDFTNPTSNMQKDLDRVVLPIDLLSILDKYKKIENITVEISKLKKFYENLHKLNQEDIHILKSILNKDLSVYEFQKLQDKYHNKSLIITEAISYLEIKSLKDGLLNQKEINLLMALINLELQMTEKSEDYKVTPVKKNPLSTVVHKAYIQKQFTKNDSLNFVGYRHLYKNRFDMLDNEHKNGSVEVFDFLFAGNNNNYFLDHAIVANLETLPISNDFFSESTNKVSLGAKRAFENNKLYGYFDYGLGYRYQCSETFICDLYGKGSLLVRNDVPVSLSFEPSIEYKLFKKSVSEFKYIFTNYSNGYLEKHIEFNNYVKLLKNTNLLIALQKNLLNSNEDQIRVQVGFYF